MIEPIREPFVEKLDKPVGREVETGWPASQPGDYSWVKHISMIAAGCAWQKLPLAMMTAYFDASGKEHDQPCVVVAGFIATAKDWLAFESRWLDRIGQDGIDCFHAREVMQRFRERPGEVAALYADLIEIIRGTALQKFGCAITTRAIRSISDEDRKRWRIQAYSMAGRACAGQVSRWLATWSGSCPEYVFEDGDEGKGDLRDMMLADNFPAPLFKPKRDRVRKDGLVEKAVVPLQAADLFAFEMFDPLRKMENVSEVWGAAAHSRGAGAVGEVRELWERV